MAGSGNYKICLESDGVGSLATIDIDPSRVDYIGAPVTDHAADGTPIYQAYDTVIWEWDVVTTTLTDDLRAKEGEYVIIKTRLQDEYSFGNRKAYLDRLDTRHARAGRVQIRGTATFTKVEEL